MLETKDIGIEVSDEDFEFFRRATIGNENRVLMAIAKFSIMEMHKIGKKRKIAPRKLIFKRKDPIRVLYDDLNEKVGERTRQAINLLGVKVIRNSDGELNRIINKIDEDFETWKRNNGDKI